ncbi:hypothetical protein [Mycobacterium camsae]|uniref:hypothetical protein n=1 Tax=Mycobacterium gordonae TaxID=1778 RepID=UPI00197E350E|nr:hypothetical protein [Mycobacterium gordonae]
MNGTLDTALTIALFVIAAPIIAFFGVTGFVAFGVEVEPAPAQPWRLDRVLIVAGQVLPPLLLAGPYLAAVLLTARASGPTFYFPLTAVVAGLATSNLALRTLSAQVRRTRAGKPTAQDVLFEQRRDAEQRRRSRAAPTGEDQAGDAVNRGDE